MNETEKELRRKSFQQFIDEATRPIMEAMQDIAISMTYDAYYKQGKLPKLTDYIEEWTDERELVCMAEQLLAEQIIKEQGIEEKWEKITNE